MMLNKIVNWLTRGEFRALQDSNRILRYNLDGLRSFYTKQIKNMEASAATRNARSREVASACGDLYSAMRRIADMETTNANATVKRMAKTAREAIEVAKGKITC